MTKLISERVKAVASRKTRVQGLKDELKIRDQALRQMMDYFTVMCYITDPHVEHIPPADFFKDRECTPLALESLNKKPIPNPVLEEQITAELRVKLSLISEQPQRSEYASRRELVAELEAELDLSLKKLADLDNMSASAHAEEKDLESELEWKDQLLYEMKDAVDKMYEIDKNLQAELVALGDPNPVRLMG